MIEYAWKTVPYSSDFLLNQLPIQKKKELSELVADRTRFSRKINQYLFAVERQLGGRFLHVLWGSIFEIDRLAKKHLPIRLSGLWPCASALATAHTLKGSWHVPRSDNRNGNTSSLQTSTICAEFEDEKKYVRVTAQ